MSTGTGQPVTDAQKKGIELVGCNICVTASAGSGKTHVLVERFVHLVTARKVPIQNILTITFTEKAASEMKQRIAERFEKLGLERELREVEFAYISTIDSFTARVLREHALEANVDPEFTILDEYESRYMQRNVAETVLSGWETSNPQGFNNLLQGLHCRHLEEVTINILSRIRSTGTPLQDIIQPDVRPQDIRAVLEKISKCLDVLGRYLQVGSIPKQMSENISGLISALSPITNETITTPERLTVNHINDIAGALERYGRLTPPEPAKDSLKSLRETHFPELRRLFFERVAAGERQALKGFLLELHQKYEEEKRARGVLDFYDLTEKTIQLLRTSPHIRRALRGQFRHILVDEFQDTNRLQKDLIDLLMSEGNLFVVGDARQSIYGFRDADLDVFLRHREEVAAGGGAVIQLRENFRTRPEIIDFINHVFRDIPEDDGSTKGAGLVAASSFNEKHDPSVELILTRGDTVDEARMLEATTLARRIHDIVENEELRITRVNGHRVGVPLSYGDFAILLRSTADIKLYERALTELNIPFFIVRGRGLYNTTEVTDLVNFLKVIDNPLDEVRLAAVLRSPFVGISDECLFWLTHYSKDKHCGNGELFYTLAQADMIPEIEPHHRDRLIRFAGQLREFQNLKERLPAASLIDTILDRTGFDTRVLALTSGRQKHANIRKMVELASSLEKRGFSGLDEFFRVISDLRLRETREPEAPTDVERSDVVKVMTVHAAKGLEFPAVVVADINRLRQNRTEDLIFSRRLGLGFKVLNPLTREPEKTSSYHQISEELKQKDEGELGRVFYVALTRAQEHLILSGALGPGSKGEWLRILARNLNLPLDSEKMPSFIAFGNNGYSLRVVTSGSRRRTPSTFRVLSSPDKNKVLAGRRLTIPQRASLTAEYTLPAVRAAPTPDGKADYVYSVTEIMGFLLCPRLYYFAHRLRLPAICTALEEGATAHQGEIDEIRKGVLGSVAHAVLERFRPDFTEVQLREVVLEAFDDVSVTEPAGEQVSTVTQWVSDFYSSPIGRMVKRAPRVERELAFVFYYRGNPIRGKIDLLFSPNGSGWYLLDYKSSSADQVELRGYEFQMQLYAMAIDAVYGQGPEEAVLFFLATGETLQVDISPPAMVALEERLGLFFKAQEEGSYPKVKGQHCEWCEYRRYCGESAL